jgi:hypothetical protein
LGAHGSRSLYQNPALTPSFVPPDCALSLLHGGPGPLLANEQARPAAAIHEGVEPVPVRARGAVRHAVPAQRRVRHQQPPNLLLPPASTAPTGSSSSGGTARCPTTRWSSVPPELLVHGVRQRNCYVLHLFYVYRCIVFMLIRISACVLLYLSIRRIRIAHAVAEPPH